MRPRRGANLFYILGTFVPFSLVRPKGLTKDPEGISAVWTGSEHVEEAIASTAVLRALCPIWPYRFAIRTVDAGGTRLLKIVAASNGNTLFNSDLKKIRFADRC